MTYRLSNWSGIAIFIHRDVNDLGFRNFDLPTRFSASLGFNQDLDRHGGLSLMQHAGIEADDVPDVDRGDKTDLSHRSGNEIPRCLARSLNPSGQVDMT